MRRGAIQRANGHHSNAVTRTAVQNTHELRRTLPWFLTGSDPNQEEGEYITTRPGEAPRSTRAFATHTHRPLLTIVDSVVTVMNQGLEGRAGSIFNRRWESGRRRSVIPPRARVVPRLDWTA